LELGKTGTADMFIYRGDDVGNQFLECSTSVACDGDLPRR
jgi:hypothetical protein